MKHYVFATSRYVCIVMNMVEQLIKYLIFISINKIMTLPTLVQGPIHYKSKMISRGRKIGIKTSLKLSVYLITIIIFVFFFAIYNNRYVPSPSTQEQFKKTRLEAFVIFKPQITLVVLK